MWSIIADLYHLQSVFPEEILPVCICVTTVITYYFGVGGDVIVDLGEGACIPAKADDIPAKSGIITELPTSIPTLQPRDEVGEPQGWEILKSIVYGGLVESITSLGIVSSAVSSGVTPCKFLSSFKWLSEAIFKSEHRLIGLYMCNYG